MGQWREGAGAGDADPEFELGYLDADGSEHRELPAAWPGLRPETFMPAMIQSFDGDLAALREELAAGG